MLAEQIVNRFRVVSLERLARLEASWAKAVADPNDAEAIAAMHREVHTLKGDARMVGFTDVDLVCHKLEDMLGLAAERKYSVSDDFELIVIMAVQLIGMLIRKRAGASFGGIDLPGFIRQMDAILAETRRDQAPRVRATTATTSRIELERARDVLSPATRASLSHTALELFLESTTVQSRTSKRVQRGWHALRDLLALPSPLPIAPILGKHEAGALELAKELRKDVIVRYEVSNEIKAEPSACEALEVATLHLVRNAIDHGVESANVRVARGKTPMATIVIKCTTDNDQLRLEVADDGAGIDFAEVRRRAITQGLLPPNIQTTEAQLANVLFQPGFSTKSVATEVSGRGIGLDAVNATITALGGKTTVVSRAGQGTVWTITIPAPSRKVNAFGFAAPGSSVRFAIATDWTPEVVAPVDSALDLVEIFGLAADERPGPSVTLRVRRGDMTMHFLAAWAPVEVLVRRLLVMPPDANAEVVSIDGFEGLLVRPDRLIQGTGRVAILDDSEICREMVKSSLGPFGIEVIGLEDPTILIGTLAVTSVDMLLLDLSFEQLDLADLIRRVRAAIPELPVYLHSDRPISELQRIAEQTRADGYLSKTADADQMVQRVSRVLRGRRVER